MAKINNIRLKKKYGQNFLENDLILNKIVDFIDLKNKTILEIGPGSGFLTEKILTKNIEKLYAFEIDQDWIEFLEKKYTNNNKIKIIHNNFLDIKFEDFFLKKEFNLILIANLPYNITFPILKIIKENFEYFDQGIIMVQEEVAQKIIKTSGRGKSFLSLFFQYYFDWQILDLISPENFFPKPKVFSRLIHFKIKRTPEKINQENLFWKFVKNCFINPRKTLKNNLISSHYNYSIIDENFLKSRSEQISIQEFINIWNKIYKNFKK